MRLIKLAVGIGLIAGIFGAILWTRAAAARRYLLSRELWAAVDANDANRALSLLNAGADPNVRESPTERPSDLASWLRSVIAISLPNGTGQTALMRAVSKRERPIVELLLKYGANANVDEAGVGCALGIAAGDGQDQIVHILLQSGADPNMASPRGYAGYPPVVAALQQCHAPVIQELIAHGGRINPHDDLTVEFALRNPDNRVLDILFHRGLAVNSTVRGKPLLFLAAGIGNVPAAELLLSRGADINSRDASGTTALRCAVRAGLEGGSTWWEEEHSAMCRFLRSHGANE